MSIKGEIRFGTLSDDRIHAASFTLATGVSPSTATLTVAPGTYTLREGVLSLSCAGFSASFAGCIVADVSADVADSGEGVWKLSVLDRRWKWSGLGRISGYYNSRLEGEIREETKKSARDLLKLCFDALGETNVGLSQVPTQIFPETSWDYTEPSQAIAKICEELRYVVVLNLRDRVEVVPEFSGNALPRLSSCTAYAETIDPPEVPSEIVIVGGRTRYNGWWKLEAVGLENDERIVPLNQLSYKPTGGWESADLTKFLDVAVGSRDLAKRSVYRMYRIVAPVTLPGIAKPIESLERILPIDDDQVDRVDVETGRKWKKRAQIFGVFYNGKDDFGVWYTNRRSPNANVPQAKYPEDFEIDVDTGVVSFDEQMVRFLIGSDYVGGKAVIAADLWLRCGVSLRDKETRGWERHEWTRKLRSGLSKTLPKYVTHEDLIREVSSETKDGKVVVTDNVKQLDGEANRLLDRLEADYKSKTPATASYGRFERIEPSGSIPAVTFTVEESGFCSTRATYQREPLDLPIPTRAEIRSIERQRAAEAEARVPPRAKRDKARRDS